MEPKKIIIFSQKQKKRKRKRKGKLPTLIQEKHNWSKKKKRENNHTPLES